MRYKTLVIGKGTKFQEFYGYENDYGWVTSQIPIEIMREDVTWDAIKKFYPNNDFEGVELVTIEINII